MTRLLLACILIISATLGHAMLTTGHDWGDDFAQYLLQAQSIVQGRAKEFIDDNRFSIENSTESSAPTPIPGAVLSAWHRLIIFSGSI